MNRKLKSIKDDYIKDAGIYDGNYPNINTSSVSDEDVRLHAAVKTAAGIKDLQDTNRTYLMSILSSVNVIKWLLIFWSVLGGIGMILYIINAIKMMKYLP